MSRILGGFIYFVLCLEGIIFIKSCLLRSKYMYIFFYFLLSFLTYADVDVAINLLLANS